MPEDDNGYPGIICNGTDIFLINEAVRVGDEIGGKKNSIGSVLEMLLLPAPPGPSMAMLTVFIANSFICMIYWHLLQDMLLQMRFAG